MIGLGSDKKDGDDISHFYFHFEGQGYAPSSDKRGGENKEPQDEQAIGKQIFNSVPP